MKLLKENQWQKIYQFLEKERLERRIYTGAEDSCRDFFTAILWMTRSGAQWRLLPERFGNWNTIYKRFARWSNAGVFSRMFEYFANDPDMESIMVDSTTVRAHACAANVSKKK